MTQFKGTPGPWRRCGYDRGGCICGQVWSIPADFPVAEVKYKVEEMGELPLEQMKANARLIAAAPELLELLDELVKIETLLMVCHEFELFELKNSKIQEAKSLITKITQP